MHSLFHLLGPDWSFKSLLALNIFTRRPKLVITSPLLNSSKFIFGFGRLQLFKVYFKQILMQILTYLSFLLRTPGKAVTSCLFVNSQNCFPVPNIFETRIIRVNVILQANTCYPSGKYLFKVNNLYY